MKNVKSESMNNRTNVTVDKGDLLYEINDSMTTEHSSKSHLLTRRGHFRSTFDSQSLK